MAQFDCSNVHFTLLSIGKCLEKSQRGLSIFADVAYNFDNFMIGWLAW